MTGSKIFFICCLTFIAGIAIASFLPDRFLGNPFLWFLGAAACLVLLVFVWKKSSSISSADWRMMKGGFFVLLSVCLAFWRFGISLEKDASGKIRSYNGGKIEFVGVIIKEPDERENKIKYEVESESVDGKKVSGKVLVNAGLHPSFDYGDRVRISCRLQSPERIEDFAYDRFLARYSIYSVCYFPEIGLLAAGNGNMFYGKIFSFKDAIREKIDKGLPEPESGLAKGFILGDKKSIDSGLNDKFSRIGISHIVAISGANVSILINLIMLFAVGVGLSRRVSFYFSSSVLAVYIILVGFPASAMRAGLMGFLILWAIHLGRLSKSANALVLAAAMMLSFNPKILRDDVGFQLSFLAMLSIIYLYPALDAFLEKIRITDRLNLREIIAMTLAAQIFTLPILASSFHQVSSVFLLSNFLVLWSLPILMAFLPVSILSGFLIGYDSLVFFPAYLVLKYIVIISEALSSLPFAYVRAPEIRWWLWTIYYFAIFYLIVKIKKGDYPSSPFT